MASHGLPIGSFAYDQPERSPKGSHILSSNWAAKLGATTSKITSVGPYIKNASELVPLASSAIKGVSGRAADPSGSIGRQIIAQEKIEKVRGALARQKE